MAQTSVKAIPLKSFASASLTASYQAIYSGGLPAACFYLRIQNQSSTAITVSYDGVTDHLYLPTLAEERLNAQANAQPNAQGALVPKGTVVYVKGTAGTGSVYLSGYYV